MDIDLNIDDALRIAEQVETDAGSFYQQAAMVSPNARNRRKLLELAAMEDDHSQIFAAIRTDLVLGPVSPQAPNGDQQRNTGSSFVINTIAANAKEDLARLFSGKDRPRDILRHAISFEKDTIVLLIDLKGMLGDPSVHAKLDLIIREELGHILTLMGQLATVH